MHIPGLLRRRVDAILYAAPAKVEYPRLQYCGSHYEYSDIGGIQISNKIVGDEKGKEASTIQAKESGTFRIIKNIIKSLEDNDEIEKIPGKMEELLLQLRNNYQEYTQDNYSENHQAYRNNQRRLALALDILVRELEFEEPHITLATVEQEVQKIELAMQKENLFEKKIVQQRDMQLSPIITKFKTGTSISVVRQKEIAFLESIENYITSKTPPLTEDKKNAIRMTAANMVYNKILQEGRLDALGKSLKEEIVNSGQERYLGELDNLSLADLMDAADIKFPDNFVIGLASCLSAYQNKKNQSWFSAKSVEQQNERDEEIKFLNKVENYLNEATPPRNEIEKNWIRVTAINLVLNKLETEPGAKGYLGKVLEKELNRTGYVSREIDLIMLNLLSEKVEIPDHLFSINLSKCVKEYEGKKEDWRHLIYTVKHQERIKERDAEKLFLNSVHDLTATLPAIEKNEVRASAANLVLQKLNTEPGSKGELAKLLEKELNSKGYVSRDIDHEALGRVGVPIPEHLEMHSKKVMVANYMAR